MSVCLRGASRFGVLVLKVKAPLCRLITLLVVEKQTFIVTNRTGWTTTTFPVFQERAWSLCHLTGTLIAFISQFSVMSHSYSFFYDFAARLYLAADAGMRKPRGLLLHSLHILRRRGHGGGAPGGRHGRNCGASIARSHARACRCGRGNVAAHCKPRHRRSHRHTGVDLRVRQQLRRCGEQRVQKPELCLWRGALSSKCIWWLV